LFLNDKIKITIISASSAKLKKLALNKTKTKINFQIISS
jgi:hypothetical protein